MVQTPATKTEAETTKILSKTPKRDDSGENTHLRKTCDYHQAHTLWRLGNRFRDILKTEVGTFGTVRTKNEAVIKKVPNKTAIESERAIQGHFSRLPRQLRRSITRDNGTENVSTEK